MYFHGVSTVNEIYKVLLRTCMNEICMKKYWLSRLATNFDEIIHISGSMLNHFRYSATLKSLS